MASPVWCPGGGKHDERATPHEIVSGVRPTARFTRCAECGRRLKQRVRECHDPGCWHVQVPPHKVRPRRSRNPGRQERRVRRV